MWLNKSAMSLLVAVALVVPALGAASDKPLVATEDTDQESGNQEDGTDDDSADLQTAPSTTTAPAPPAKLPDKQGEPTKGSEPKTYWVVPEGREMWSGLLAAPQCLRSFITTKLTPALDACRESEAKGVAQVGLILRPSNVQDPWRVIGFSNAYLPDEKLNSCLAKRLRMPIVDSAEDPSDSEVNAIPVTIAFGTVAELANEYGKPTESRWSLARRLPEVCQSPVFGTLCGAFRIGTTSKDVAAAIKNLGPRWKMKLNYGRKGAEVSGHDAILDIPFHDRGAISITYDNVPVATVGLAGSRVIWLMLESPALTAGNGLKVGMTVAEAATVIGDGMVFYLRDDDYNTSDYALIGDDDAPIGFVNYGDNIVSGILVDENQTGIGPHRYFKRAQRDASTSPDAIAYDLAQDPDAAAKVVREFPFNLQRCQATISEVLSAFAAERTAGQRGSMSGVDRAMKRRQQGLVKLKEIHLQVLAAIKVVEQKGAGNAAAAMRESAANCLAGRKPYRPQPVRLLQPFRRGRR